MWGSTGRVPFSTCETVATETPAERATSAMVGMRSPFRTAARGARRVGPGREAIPSEGWT
ncbi:hypothetical protein GCM10018783_69470 [Streptomyces griseosporeus]|nr:hypothetical protein GCM10018783_69470 [Streptomyces griseosporeus]